MEDKDTGKIKLEIGITRFMNNSYIFALPVIFPYLSP